MRELIQDSRSYSTIVLIQPIQSGRSRSFSDESGEKIGVSTLLFSILKMLYPISMICAIIELTFVHMGTLFAIRSSEEKCAGTILAYRNALACH